MPEQVHGHKGVGRVAPVEEAYRKARVEAAQRVHLDARAQRRTRAQRAAEAALVAAAGLAIAQHRVLLLGAQHVHRRQHLVHGRQERDHVPVLVLAPALGLADKAQRVLRGGVGARKARAPVEHFARASPRDEHEAEREGQHAVLGRVAHDGARVREHDRAVDAAAPAVLFERALRAEALARNHLGARHAELEHVGTHARRQRRRERAHFLVGVTPSARGGARTHALCDRVATVGFERRDERVERRHVRGTGGAEAAHEARLHAQRAHGSVTVTQCLHHRCRVFAIVEPFRAFAQEIHVSV